MLKSFLNKLEINYRYISRIESNMIVFSEHLKIKLSTKCYTFWPNLLIMVLNIE